MLAPRISVLVVSYDRTEFVVEALRSVIGQDLDTSEFETILLTNRSDPEIDRLLAGHSIQRLEPPPGNWGEWVLAALPRCRGEVLAFLDDDDIYEAGKLAAVREAFASAPPLGYYHHRVRRFGATGRSSDALGPVLGRLPDAQKNRRVADRLFWDLGGFNLSSIAVRRSVVEENAELLRALRVGHSLALFYASMTGPWDLQFDSRVLGRYRIHARNQSIPAGTSLARDWGRARERVAPVIDDAERIAAFIDFHGRGRVSSRPVRSVGARSRLVERLSSATTSRTELAEGLAGFLGLTPPRIAFDHRRLVGLCLLGLLEPRLPARWAGGRPGPSGRA